MSIRNIVRRVIVPSIAIGASATTAAFYGPWLDIQFFGADAASRALLWIDPESAHDWAVWAAERRLLPRDHRSDPPVLRTHLWGREYRNPIGLAAGFDKNARAMEGMLEMGFGFVEIGSVTPLTQKGNAQPRVFRIPEHKAVINRYGFNSEGIDKACTRLSAFRDAHPDKRVGVNLGVNKTNAPDWQASAADYIKGVKKLGHFADYLVINISSPNTVGLRALQNRTQFASLVSRIREAMKEVTWGKQGPPPLFVKIAPDLTQQDKQDIARVARNGGFDGLIISNTTISREGAGNSAVVAEKGGMSGAPLFDISTALIREMYSLTKGSVPIIGCGGISDGYQAYEKIKAGASLVQIYTGLIYEGPSLVPNIKAELIECLQRDHYTAVWQAVGTEHQTPKK